MIKLIIFTLLLLFITKVQAQLINNKDCWKCYQEFRNENHQLALEHCSKAIIATTDNPESAQYSLLGARIQMHLEDYDGAITTLERVSSSASFLQSMVFGLRGDCYVELGNRYAAIENYNLAIWEDPNDLTTPIYLLKAYWLTREMGVQFLGEDYIQTIISEFPEFANFHQIYKYAPNIEIHNSIPLEFKEIVQPKILGIGTTNGKPVSVEAFKEAFWLAQENSNRAAAQQGQQETPVDETAVWGKFVTDKLMAQEFDLLGLNVSPTEFGAYLLGKEGFPVLPDVESNFRDENGIYDPTILQARIREMVDSDDPEIRQAWRDSKEYYTLILKREKYKVLLATMNYQTKFDVSREIHEHQTYDYLSIVKPYSEYPTGQFEFSNDEIRTHFETEKESGKLKITEDASSLMMIDVPIKKSSQDTAEVFQQLLKLKTEFAKTLDDSSFLMMNSNFKFYSTEVFSTGVPINSEWAELSYITYPESIDDFFLKAKVGDIVGPFVQDTAARMVKVIGHTSENTVARHILIQHDQADPENTLIKAKKLFNSTTNDNFAERAKLFSDDRGSAARSGELGEFYCAQMVQPFSSYCADAPIGQIGFVESQFGYHIVQVTGRSGRKYPRLAVVEKSLKPSPKNIENSKDRAMKIIEKLSSASKGNSIVEKVDFFESLKGWEGENRNSFAYIYTVQTNNPNIYGLELKSAENELLNFIHDEKTSAGTIGSVPINAGNKWIVPVLMYHYPTLDQKDEYIPYRETIHYRLEKEKIQEILTKEFESMTDEEFNKNAELTTSSLKSLNIVGQSFEVGVIGNAIQAFNNDEKTMILPGNYGVYYIKLVEKNEAPEVDSLRLKVKNELFWSKAITKSIQRALNKKAHVIDNRKLFKLGIRK